MRILLTNDDGIKAAGIAALHTRLTDLGEVFAVAPKEVQSATSHGITFHEPLMIRDVRVNETFRGVSVAGRPADCVKLALTSLWPQRMGGTPDLCVSGINLGANVGIHICYSGTVAAAIEAAFLGTPAIALSLHIRRYPDVRWRIAADWAVEAIRRVIAEGLPQPREVININLPACESNDETFPEMRVVPMNLSPIRDRFEQRTSPSGDTYFWAAGEGLDFHETASGSDVEAMFEGCIAVTPLKYDLTDHAMMQHWRSRLDSAAPTPPQPTPGT